MKVQAILVSALLVSGSCFAQFSFDALKAKVNEAKAKVEDLKANPSLDSAAALVNHAKDSVSELKGEKPAAAPAADAATAEKK